MYVEPKHIQNIRGLFTQEEFAEKVGVHRVTLAVWETTGRIGKRSARRLVENFGLDRRYVLPTAPAATDARADLSSRGAA